MLTSPDVNVKMWVLATEKESHKQESEEDASSVSSVEYFYSEEDDSDEDDEECLYVGDASMTNSTATKKNEEIISITDVALKYSLNLVSDSGWEVREWSSKPNSYSKVEPEVHDLKPRCDSDLEVFGYQFQVKPPLGPQFEYWVDSWKRKCYETLYAWVHVYAYHNKNKGCGGYGVILRDMYGNPITASAMYSRDAKSFFTQVLMGVKAGLILAEMYNLSELRVESNSTKVADLVDRLWNCRNVKCRTGGNTSVCKQCLGYLVAAGGCDPSLLPLVREIKARLPEGHHLQDVLGYRRSLNTAAHYLAKMGKKNRSKVENKDGRIVPGDEWPAEILPSDFPQKLKEILFEGAFSMKHYDDVARW